VEDTKRDEIAAVLHEPPLQDKSVLDTFLFFPSALFKLNPGIPKNMKNPSLKFLAVAALSLGSIGAAKAATVYEKTITFLNVDSGGTVTNFTGEQRWDMMVGTYGTSQDAVLSFYLPTLTAGTEFKSFTISTCGLWDQGGSLDLYGLGTTATPTTTTAKYYVGTAANDTWGNPKLQTGLLASGGAQGRVTTVDLTAYINTLYTNGLTPSNPYVQFRLNMEGAGAQKLGTASAQNYPTMDGVCDPTTGVFTPTDLSALNGMTQYVAYTVGAVPEPTTWASLVGGAGMLVLIRRRRA
jgi:hypothetical protein